MRGYVCVGCVCVGECGFVDVCVGVGVGVCRCVGGDCVFSVCMDMWVCG